MALTDKQTLFLRKQCHHLKPVVIIGSAGLTENVLNEIDNALAHHELIKVKINASDKELRSAMIEKIIESTSSCLIQTIGHTASFYRQAEKPVIEIPKK